MACLDGVGLGEGRGGVGGQPVRAEHVVQPPHREVEGPEPSGLGGGSAVDRAVEAWRGAGLDLHEAEGVQVHNGQDHQLD